MVFQMLLCGKCTSRLLHTPYDPCFPSKSSSAFLSFFDFLFWLLLKYPPILYDCKSRGYSLRNVCLPSHFGCRNCTYVSRDLQKILSCSNNSPTFKRTLCSLPFWQKAARFLIELERIHPPPL
jgi:hypothetical protein